MWIYSSVTQRCLGFQNLALSMIFSNSGLWQGYNLRSCYYTNKFALCSRKLFLFPKMLIISSCLTQRALSLKRMIENLKKIRQLNRSLGRKSQDNLIVVLFNGLCRKYLIIYILNTEWTFLLSWKAVSKNCWGWNILRRKNMQSIINLKTPVGIKDTQSGRKDKGLKIIICWAVKSVNSKITRGKWRKLL